LNVSRIAIKKWLTITTRTIITEHGVDRDFSLHLLEIGVSARLLYARMFAIRRGLAFVVAIGAAMLPVCSSGCQEGAGPVGHLAARVENIRRQFGLSNDHKVSSYRRA